MGNDFVVMYNTGNEKNAEFLVLDLISGEGSKDPDNLLTMTGGLIKGLNLVVVDESSFYLLLNVTKGKLTFVKTSTTYEFLNESLGIALFSFNNQATIMLKLLDVIAYATSSFRFVPSKLILYYPYLNTEVSTPEILLAAYMNQTEQEGIILYGFETITTSQTSSYMFGQNPFLTDTNCRVSCQRCLYVDHNMCVACDGSSAYLVANDFQCNSPTCLEGYYLTSAKVCKKCHFMCKSCKGPLSTQCLSCKSANSILSAISDECSCLENYYIYKGDCVFSCPSSHIGADNNHMCYEKCPQYSIYSVSYNILSNSQEVNKLYTSEGKDHLEFFHDSRSCLQLPGPTNEIKTPSQFTISFWIYVKQIASNKETSIIWGFNNFFINSFANKLAFIIKFKDSTATTGYTTNAIPMNAWFFVAGSAASSSSEIQMNLYTGQKDLPLTEIKAKVPYQKFAVYYNGLALVCEPDYNPLKIVESFPQRPWINAYIREIVYQSQYHSLVSMNKKKLLVYSSNLKIYETVLAYWRFDSLSSTVDDSLLHDLSRFAQVASIAKLINPKVTLDVPNTPNCVSSWDDFGACSDIFFDLGFPKFTLDTTNFAYSYVKLGLEMISKKIQSTMIYEDDRILFSFSGCKGQPLLENMVNLDDDGLISIVKIASLPESVYGKHVDVCYKSSYRGTVINIGQVYYPKLPTQIYPQSGSNYFTNAASIKFDLRDGDQCVGDILTLFDMTSQLATSLEENIRIDEAALSLFSKRTEKNEFSKLVTTGFTPGFYTVIWKPYYITYKDVDGFISYKNMYVSWTVQEVPKVKFSLVAGFTDIYNNLFSFKGGYYHPVLMGEGQIDGDELMFCYASCQYSNIQGQIYKRRNGEYPPVWFGEETGVRNLLNNKVYNRLYMCWRPYTTTQNVEAKKDTWYPIKEYYRPSKDAYIEVQNISENEKLPEIIGINPPINDPILKLWGSVNFTISKCKTLQTKPGSYNSIPGRVQIVHISYVDALHFDYVSEVLWEQLLYSGDGNDASKGFTIGKLHGDPTTCFYKLYELPYSSFLPGETYALVIYSRSFKFAGENYLFGNLDAGTIPFTYFFTYQDAVIENGTHQILPSSNTIIINGKHLGDLLIQGVDFIEEKKFFEAITTFSTDNNCETDNLTAGYIMRSWANSNPKKIVLNGFDGSTCNGNITADITLIKVSQILGSAVWTYRNFYNVFLGEIGCHESCLTCTELSDEACTSCNMSSSRPYLYKGMCVAECPSDLPYVQPVFERKTYIMSYYSCVAECSEGNFLEPGLKTCYRCSPECRTCKDDKPTGCLSCYGLSSLISGSTWETNNSYHEYYYFQNMCLHECPVIINEASSGRENIIIEDYYLKKCFITNTTTKEHPINVTIDYERVNVKSTLTLRASLYNPTKDSVHLEWSVDPPENTAVPDFYTSDERVFYSYETRDQDMLTREINMNTFNYRTTYNKLKVLAVATTSDSIGFCYTELAVNTPPELNFLQTSVIAPNIYKTNDYIDIYLDEVHDVDDYDPIFKFNVLLVVNSIVLPASLMDSTSRFQFLNQAKLTSVTLSIYSSRIMKTIGDSIVLKNVFIPPLITEPKAFEKGISSDIVSCSLVVLCEDRYKDATRATISINVTETYRSSMRTSKLENLNHLLSVNNITWDYALRAAHTLKVVVPKKSDYNVPYQDCARDSHCSNRGKCRVQKGYRKCECEKGFVGRTCDWERNELELSHNITKRVVDFLFDTLINPKKVVEYDQQTIAPHNIYNQLANVMIGILNNPEAVSDEHIERVVNLTQYIANMTAINAAKLEDYEMKNIFTAIDSAIQYIIYGYKEAINKLNILENRKFESFMMKAEFDSTRQKMAKPLIEIKEALYEFLNKLSNSLYTTSSEYQMSFNTFSMYLKSTTELTLFEALGNELGLQYADAYFQFPPDFLKNMRGKVLRNSEFRIRLVLWKENVFIFSDHTSGMCTNVYNLAILDSKGEEVELILDEPIIYFLPMNKVILTNTSEYLSCRVFNSSLIRNITTMKKRLHDVNHMDEPNRTKHPEWNSELFAANDLIVGNYIYSVREGVYPDFVSLKGLSSYGSTLKPQHYADQLIPCAAYHLGDVVGVIHYQRADVTSNPIMSHYDHFYSWDRLKGSLGYTLSFVLVGTLIFVWIICFVVDYICVPNIIAKLEANRASNLPKVKKFGKFKKKDNDIDTSSQYLQTTSSKKTKNEEHKGKSISASSITENDLVTVSEFQFEASDFSNKDKDAKSSSVSLSTTNPQNATVSDTSQNAEIDEATELKIDRPITVDSSIGNELFLKEGKLKQEKDEFHAFTIYWNSNILLNLIIRTSSTYPRTSRCILFYMQVFLVFLVSALIIRLDAELDYRREDSRSIVHLLRKHIWIMCVVPIFEKIAVIFYGMLFKLKETQIMKCNTIKAYSQLR